MTKLDKSSKRSPTRWAPLVFGVAALPVCLGLQGCLVIGGSSRGGFFIWPGSLGLLLLIVLAILVLRRR